MRELDTFTVATQGLISTFSNIDKDRQENRREDRAEKSVLRNLGQAQLALFERICTTKYSAPGEYNSQPCSASPRRSPPSRRLAR
jgi:hypothetical protein